MFLVGTKIAPTNILLTNTFVGAMPSQSLVAVPPYFPAMVAGLIGRPARVERYAGESTEHVLFFLHLSSVSCVNGILKYYTKLIVVQYLRPHSDDNRF